MWAREVLQDPKHVVPPGKRGCTRCGGSLRHNSKTCPPGFWMTEAEQEAWDAATSWAAKERVKRNALALRSLDSGGKSHE